MRFTRFIICLFAVAIAGIVASCGTDDPTTIDRPPVVRSFVPVSQFLDAFVGDTLLFAITAVDPDETTLKQRYMLDDSVVSRHARWHYVVDDTGTAFVRCVVSDGAYDSRIEWQIERSIPVTYPPEILDYTPVESKPVLILGDDLEFIVQASDPDGDSLRFYISVDDSVVSTEPVYLFIGDRIGEFGIEAVVTDGEYFVSLDWMLLVTPVPDTIPPALVEITVVETGTEPGEVDLAWIAVGADEMEGLASDYHVRTSPSPIDDEAAWQRASERPDVPPPAAPGEVMEMVLEGLTPARFTYIAIRAEDNFGNLSPLGETPGQYTRGMRITGKVFDAVTGEPMPNVHVSLAHFKTTTGLDGEFGFIELPPLDELLIVSDDDQYGVLGTHYDIRIPYNVVHLDYIPVYLLPDVQMEDDSVYDDFLQFFVIMTQRSGSPYPNHQRRWEPPIDIFANPFTKGGLDYQLAIHETALELNPYLGMDLFNVVDAVPDVGVTCRYFDELAYDNYGVTEWSPDWYPVKGEIEFRTVYTGPTEIPFRIVARHELGHVLGLNHSVDMRHLMIGGVSPQAHHFAPVEIAVIRARFHIPRGLTISYYLRE